MKHRNPKILFFSLSDARVDSFFQTIEDNKLTYNENALFSLEEKKKYFSHGADLLMFLDNYKDNIQSLHVILDIESISEKLHSEEKDEQEKQEQVVLQIDYIRKAILSYPEVQFLLDIRANGNKNVVSMLFPDEKEVLDQTPEIKEEWVKSKEAIIDELISIKWEIVEGDEEADDLSLAFYWAISGKDNTFDASNLRYALKLWKYISLKVYEHRNYSKLQDSRKDYLAICVEEEAKQNVFNSYALFANGFRVLPVSSAFELNRTNKLVTCRKFNNDRTIIVRDYDLQFEDEGKNVNKIRGYKYVSNNNSDDGYELGWNDQRKHDPICKEDVNTYWSNLSDYPEYYITKGPKHSKVKKARRGKQSKINKSRKTLYLRGILKPVSGLYVSLHSIAAVKDRYKATRYSIRDKGYEIITSRKNHDHSTPLDIYEMINNMLRRSESYYSNGRYRLAALVSEEALEIMNGFHLRLMIKASYINAKAENAISMDIVGGDEDILGEDANFRINKIQEDIHRLHFNKGQLNYEKSTNVLNQIFSDCRIFCKDKEHFKAEDRFLSAMGHLNEGDFLPRFIHYCWDLILFKKHHDNED